MSRGSTIRVAYRLARHEPVAYLSCLAWFAVFFALPLVGGVAVKVVLDRLATPGATAPWGLLAILVGLETARWSMFVGVAVQWHGSWVG